MLTNLCFLQEKHVQDQTKKPYNPFLSSPSSETKPETSKPSSSDILDFFGSSSTNYESNNQNISYQTASKASDDLLMLANNNTSLNSAAAAAPNPFVDMLSGSMAGQSQSGLNGSSLAMSNTGCFDANFAAVFGSENSNTSSGNYGLFFLLIIIYYYFFNFNILFVLQNKKMGILDFMQ